MTNVAETMVTAKYPWHALDTTNADGVHFLLHAVPFGVDFVKACIDDDDEAALRFLELPCATAA